MTWVLIGCAGGNRFALSADKGILRWRCQETRCPERRNAKQRHQRTYHILNLATMEQWTEYEPVETGEEEP